MPFQGKTFRYGAHGPEGLAGGRKVITVFVARRTFYLSGFVSSRLSIIRNLPASFFGFLAITDISFIRAEGVAMGDERRQQAIAAAKAEITRLAA